LVVAHKDLSEEAKERKRAGCREYLRAKPPEYHMFTRAKDRAKKANQPFNITIEDIIIPAVCPYLGIPLQVNRKKQNDGSPSLDRINPSLGYIKGNIEVISNKANAMKYNATSEELLIFANAIIRRYNKETARLTELEPEQVLLYENGGALHDDQRAF